MFGDSYEFYSLLHPEKATNFHQKECDKCRNRCSQCYDGALHTFKRDRECLAIIKSHQSPNLIY